MLVIAILLKTPSPQALSQINFWQKILKLDLGTDLGPSLLEPSHKGLSGTIEVGHVCTGEYADVVKEAEVGIVTDC